MRTAPLERLSPRVFYVLPLAVVVRLLYLSQHVRSPLFHFPVLDALYYDTVARLLAQGESVAAINPGFRPLLYPWLLSGLYRLAPQSAISLAIVAQHLLGIASVVLTAWIAFRVSRSNLVAATAGSLFALAGPPLYFEGEILLTSLTTFLNLCLVALLVGCLTPRPDGAPSDRWRAVCWLLAGAGLGVAAQTRPNVLLFAAALPLGAAFLARSGERGVRWRRVVGPTALALGGLLVALALAGVWQRPAFGQFRLLTGAGGVNFYLGNKQRADGMVPRQDRSVTYADSYRDSVQVFARQEYARVRGLPFDRPTSAEISRYWWARGFREIADAPLAWAGLMARKAWFLVWNREIPNNRSYHWVAANESALLRWLPVRWWLLVALAPLGVVAARRAGRSAELLWIVLFVACWSAGLWLFFVNSRYRAPLWPLMCVLAAAGGVHCVELVKHAIRTRRWGPLWRPAAAVLFLAALSLVNWLGIPEPGGARDLFYRSVANLELGRLREARADAAAAVLEEGSEALYHFQLANVLLAEDLPGQALESLGEAVRLRPDEPRIWNNLGVTLERLDRPALAYPAYRRAIELVGDYAPALANAALLELRGGLVERAAAHLAQTEGEVSPSVHLLCARAFLAAARGRQPEAQALLERAREIDPEVVGRLEAESRRPLYLAPDAAPAVPPS